jgi:hypothetical protein
MCAQVLVENPSMPVADRYKTSTPARRRRYLRQWQLPAVVRSKEAPPSLVGVLKQASTVAPLVVQVKYNEFTDFVLSFGVICGDISNLLCHLISSVND